MTEVSQDEPFGPQGRAASASAAGSNASRCCWCGLPDRGFCLAMPQSFLTWGNFSILFASYAPAAMLALAIIVPLTAGDYDLSVGATLTLSSARHRRSERLDAYADPAGPCDRYRHRRDRRPASTRSFIFFFRVPSLVVTLGTTSVMSGLVQWITNSSTIGGIETRWSWRWSATALRRALCVLLRVRRRDHHVVRVRLHSARPPAAVRGSWPGGGAAQWHCGRSRRVGALVTSAALASAGGHLLCRRSWLGRPVFGTEFPSPRICGCLSWRDDDIAGTLQPLGHDRSGLFSGNGYHRPDDVRYSAVCHQCLQRRRADPGRYHFADHSRTRNVRHRLTAQQ